MARVQENRWISSSGVWNSASSWDLNIKPGEQDIATLTASANPADGDTVTIGSATYRFKSTIVAAHDVKRDASDATVSMANLTKALMDSGVPNTNYVPGTDIPNLDVTAVDGTSDDVDITRMKYGSLNMGTSATGAALLWGGANMTGGVNNWDIDAVALFDGISSQVSVVGANYQGLFLGRIITLEAYEGDIASEGTPLKIDLHAANPATDSGATVIRGSGAVYINNPGGAALITPTYIVDSPNIGGDADGKPALTCTGYTRRVFVKAGKCVVAGNLSEHVDGSVFATLGPLAHLRLEGSDEEGPQLIYVGDGYCYCGQKLGQVGESSVVVIGPRGTFEQKVRMTPPGNSFIVLNAGGKFIYDAQNVAPSNPIDVSMLMLMDGHNDMSGVGAHIANAGDSIGSAVIGPNATLNMGRNELKELVYLDLREEIPGRKCGG